ncbi:MAG: MlaE family lipid ABC transporter permease subunit [Candidatus Contendobacter sp.]|nr:MlaE family lipid ABC transporter permease subunit [Candidatus Contendobacter sp.]
MPLDGSGIRAIDTTGALELLSLIAELEHVDHPVQLIGLHEQHQALLDLVCDRLATAGSAAAPPPALNSLERLGQQVVFHTIHAADFLAFIGEAAVALGRLALHPGRFRWRALLGNLETAGVNALPIIALLSFMMGIVIAYQGGQQLKTYGANIFIVELVSLTMLRELAPLITAIIVAGRTGSAYTAQIGTMQVTEEVDALRTIGIPPMDLLVLPKLLALTIALPLLTVFADALSVFGGMVMARALLEVSFSDFLDRFPLVVTPTSFLLGVSKAPVFAAIIALVGCYQGFQVRGGADSVGRQTTVSVVQSIFLVIAADALFSVVLGGVGLWR